MSIVKPHLIFIEIVNNLSFLGTWGLDQIWQRKKLLDLCFHCSVSRLIVILFKCDIDQALFFFQILHRIYVLNIEARADLGFRRRGPSNLCTSEMPLSYFLRISI